ncbi:MAG: DegT/DnrJ/EryC1/StrS family aminotransferase [Anaerolineales bacterium]
MSTHTTKTLPAILGGEPSFPQKIPMVRPVLPSLDEMAEGIQRILESGMVTKGPFMRQFEQAIAEHLGVKHAIAVSSCTSGMMLVHKCLDLQGEVILPSFTFMATASAAVWAGLRPVFADVDRETNNLDPAAAEAAITPRTVAIVAVHQFGNPADIAGLQQVAERHELKLIFDAAHGFGAQYQGEPIGKQGDAQIFSLSPTKLLITGEGGIVATNDDTLAERIRMGREYGNDGNYDSAFPGLNARMPEFNALLGLHSLKRLEEAARHRNEIVALFQELLGHLPGIGFQKVRPGDRHSYRELSITIDAGAFGLTRDEVALALEAENIDTRKYYDPPIHRQKAYQQYYDARPLPNTDWLSTNSLSLPMWSNMSEAVATKICRAFERLHENAPQVRRKLNIR